MRGEGLREGPVLEACAGLIYFEEGFLQGTTCSPVVDNETTAVGNRLELAGCLMAAVELVRLHWDCGGGC
jgi:hypothetical protein